MKIGKLAKIVNVSVDTLRYYEKIGLLSDVDRSESRYRIYGNHNIEQVDFIKKAQRCGFSLEDIANLMELKLTPVDAKPKVRGMVDEKVRLLTIQIDELVELRDELQALANLCRQVDSHCPIIDTLSKPR